MPMSSTGFVPHPHPVPAPGPLPVPDKGIRRVLMSLDGKEHDLQVGYIAQTPVWRPSYRLVIDKDAANLQTWGIVQNLSGEDWNNVSLSLVAEAPLAFDASLATPVIPPRPTVTDGGDVIAVVPRSETSLSQEAPAPPPAPAAAPMSAMEMEKAESAPAGKGAVKKKPAPARRMRADDSAADMVLEGIGGGSGRAAAAPYSRQTKNLAALAAIAVQAGATRYDLPNVVSIPNKSATMVMLLDQRVPGEVVALYAPDGGVPESSSHPFKVARFANKTGGLLERGPIAIFTEAAFAGQGMTDALPEGATATVPFGLDRSVALEVSREHRQEGARLYHIEGAVLTIARDAVSMAKYKIKNGANKDARLVIKHPRSNGARMINFPPGTEDNVGTGSALVPVTVGARATQTLVLDERQETTRNVDWMEPLADDAVRAYLADRRADPTVVAQLKAAWEIRQVLVKSTGERDKLASEEADLRRATEETRQNLKALEKNTAAADLRAKLTTRLGNDSARLDVISKKLIEIDLRLSENRVRFGEAVRAIKVAAPLPA
jgi:hypothetical protein